MYRELPYNGEGLPPKCLCLTYDDGPGKNTLEIAKFLHEQKIRATFFVVGKYAVQCDDLLNEVSKLGHLIGNHTYDHPDMPYYLSRNGDIQSQILRTDSIITKYNKANAIFFRSPYGKWSKEVSKELNSNFLTSVNHIGPIHWDIAGNDCFYWKNEESVEAATEKYLSEIHQKGRGIIVMHDENADMQYLQVKNKTIELTKQLIPILKSEGYTFIGLDEMKLLKQASIDEFDFYLKTPKGKFLGLTEDGRIKIDFKRKNLHHIFQLVDLEGSRFALRASNGLFLSLEENKSSIIKATKKEIKDYEKFDLVPLTGNDALFRGHNGCYLKIEKQYGKSLAATAEYMRGGDILTICSIKVDEKIKYSLFEKIKSIKRKFLYIKSKIEQGALV